ncbi:MAG: gliding motility-associated protein GldE [Bacteroidota bacterium]|nr:gliding motility-associated protein GldE [Bacteroidota bacterium]
MESNIDDPFPGNIDLGGLSLNECINFVPYFWESISNMALFLEQGILCNYINFLTLQNHSFLQLQIFPLAEILNPSVIFYLANGILLFVLLFLSAIISGSEVAFFSLSSQDIIGFKESNNTSENRMVHLLERPRLLLATILILNNLVNVAIVTLSTFISWKLAGNSASEGKIVVVLTFVITFLIVFFGEVVPKVYANQNNVLFAKRTSIFISIAQSFLKPVSYFLMSISDIIEKRVVKRGYNISMDQLNHALEITTVENKEEGRDILKGIVNFSSLSVKQVMKSRLDITAIDIELDFHELMDRVNKSGYSRIPVYKETIDKIEGILYIKDLLPYLDQNENFEWQRLLRSGYFIPESKKIDSLLRDFQDKRVHVAIVVDEYGGTSGLITLEDIIEEIVGEINDEFDEDDIAFNKLDNNTYIFEGKTSLNDFCKIINVDPNIFEDIKGESESLGGLLLEINSKLPRVGEKVKFNRFVFTIVSVDVKRIKRVRVFLKPLEQEVPKKTM